MLGLALDRGGDAAEEAREKQTRRVAEEAAAAELPESVLTGVAKIALSAEGIEPEVTAEDAEESDDEDADSDEDADEESLGGAEMHTSVSGLGEYLCEDDRHALGTARDVVARWDWAAHSTQRQAKPPRWDAEELLGLMPAHHREPIDMREVILRLVDDSDFLEFKPLFGAATVCAQARIGGHAVGIISNNGPIDVAGANKATHFIQWMCQLGHPLIYLQNTTGYMVGKDSEQGGMIKHGSKMIQAVTNATVPQITIQCGASFGAGNYGMCGRAFDGRFLWMWPQSQIAVMGAEQAANTLADVKIRQLQRHGEHLSEEQIAEIRQPVLESFQAESDAYYSTSEMWDDGILDPVDTRNALGMAIIASLNAPFGQEGYGVLRL